MSALREVELDSTGVGGALWLHSMPGRHEPLSEFLADAKRERIGLMLCLVGKDEIRKKSPEYHNWLQGDPASPIVLPFPIADFGKPEDIESFRQTLSGVADLLHDGRNVLVHCAGGVGRTGTAAVCLLGELGLTRDEALGRVWEADAGPESPEQEKFVRDFFS